LREIKKKVAAEIPNEHSKAMLNSLPAPIRKKENRIASLKLIFFERKIPKYSKLTNIRILYFDNLTVKKFSLN